MADKKFGVLILSERFFPLSTASAQRAYAYAKTLVSHSYETTVVTKSHAYFKSPKMTVIGLNVKKEIPIIDPILLLLYLIKSIRLMRKHQTNLIISTVPMINNAIAGFLLSRLFRVPHIIDIRDYWESLLLSDPLNRIIPGRLTFLLIRISSLLYRQAFCIITLNETLKEMLIERGVSSDRIFLIPNGADTSLFRPCENNKCVKQLREKYALPFSKLIFVYGGSLALHYKLDAVLKGLSHIKERSDFMFVIVGRSSPVMTHERILQMVHKLGLGENVKVMDSLEINNLAELLRCCDVGVIPLDDSDLLRQVITAKIFAYMASGLPILASGPHNGELEKFVNTHKVGFFVEKATPSGFADGFRRFLEKKTQMKKMGLKGRTIAEKYYDRYALAHRIIEVIDHLTCSCYPSQTRHMNVRKTEEFA